MCQTEVLTIGRIPNVAVEFAVASDLSKEDGHGGNADQWQRQDCVLYFPLHLILNTKADNGSKGLLKPLSPNLGNFLGFVDFNSQNSPVSMSGELFQGWKSLV